MYGFVNYALELLVIKSFGEQTWEVIKKNAEVQMEGQFLVRQIYDDELTYNLIAAAVEVLILTTIRPRNPCQYNTGAVWQNIFRILSRFGLRQDSPGPWCYS
ncbi:unnamed protein product [Callosobruchus maculatus]|uniref:Heme NO-binding domain-containing protein n=1 Tax=Callosobruchus maculatus TaxID=64391 RepID=A0A653D8T0_CALMS|nr:unnamed protein product [Callosobruchus maculatus]